MRKGFNPEKDKELEQTYYIQQVIIPVYIPHFQGYYKDSFRIFKVCVNSLIKTVCERTFITIINNGSCTEVKEFLEECLEKGVIQELIHTFNIGKLNAILKGLTGYDMPLVTVADSDVLFRKGWQEETCKIFNTFPKTGTVGLVPQFNMFSNYCTNTIYDNLFKRNLKFFKVGDPLAMWDFYKSIGWTINKDHFYFNSILCIEKNSLRACIGSGHFVATYRKELFEKNEKYMPYKLGGTSEKYLDKAAMEKGLWKLTTFKNYAYHMGNVWEDWMKLEIPIGVAEKKRCDLKKSQIKTKSSKLSYIIKNKVFKRLLRIRMFNNLFFHYTGLTSELRKKYPRIYY